jgi:S-DNA-T family DNA segregation ATPase FtsK/SpoIIIE
MVNHTTIEQLRRIADELESSSGTDLSSIRRLHDTAKELTSLAGSIGRHENVDISDAWKNAKVEEKISRFRLPIYAGVTSADDDIVVDLAQMPHLLVGGVGASGKTNFLNSLICGLVRRRSPDEVSLVLYDPKCVEFTAYSSLPHAAFQVITDDAKCMYALLSLVREMDRRLKMFARVLCRRIDDFNRRKSESEDNKVPDIWGFKAEGSADIPDAVPYIVFVIDEVAELVARFGNDFIAPFKELMSKGRAAGIHVVTATGSVNEQTLPPPLMECFQSRIAFKTHTQAESLLLVNSPDADILSGPGDMLLYRQLGMRSDLVRMQSAWISPVDVESVVDEAGKKYPNKHPVQVEPGIMFLNELIDVKKNSTSQLDASNDEEVYRRALDVIRVTKRASVPYIQLQLKIGFNRASRIIEILEKRGVVGPGTLTGRREIKIDLEESE